jgi:hypothetical protein
LNSIHFNPCLANSNRGIPHGADLGAWAGKRRPRHGSEAGCRCGRIADATVRPRPGRRRVGQVGHEGGIAVQKVVPSACSGSFTGPAGNRVAEMNADGARRSDWSVVPFPIKPDGTVARGRGGALERESV